MRVIKLTYFLFFLLILLFNVKLKAQKDVPVWSSTTYPDEAGYQRRIAGILERIATEGFGERSKARSTCPDTGLPVYTWALEGETIISPYTGKTYTQGETGYFGPKIRNESGDIIKFGGDPLKYDLPPATASLLLRKDIRKVKGFLSIPANLNQHYHFATVNWARFYPLLAKEMGENWIKDFSHSVDTYKENRRPSDGYRQYLSPLSRHHTLLGEKGDLLGGNIKDGGTENHKMMWRTSSLLYTDWLPDTAKISGVPLLQAKKDLLQIFGNFGERVWDKGNGEYDSGTYYPHSLNGLYNLFDFAKDSRSKEIASALIDYYLGTFALKSFQSVIAGAQKRSNVPTNKSGEMVRTLWSWTGEGSALIEEKAHIAIQQVTSSYRPNKVIYNLLTKQIPLPFEAEMTRPDYHVRQRNEFQEYFYCDSSFAMGTVAMTRVDNPTQQLMWSLLVKGEGKPYIFGGVQPYFADIIGHSPYTQTLQKENTILVMSANTEFTNENQEASTEKNDRKQHASEKLQTWDESILNNTSSLVEYFNNCRYSATTWLYLPK
ncbi:MAG: hypothetical protein AAGI07_16645, partial [Bacteroidota bacterium]